MFSHPVDPMRQSSEANGSAGMDQDSSKTAAADVSSATTQHSSPADPVLAASQTVKIHIPLAPPQRRGTLSSSVPTKRFLDENDPRSDILRTPLRDKFIRTSPNDRLALASDRIDDRSPSRRSGGSLSPESRRRFDRGYWSPQDSRSSPPNRTASMRRPSPVRNGSSGYIEYPRPLPRSPPPRHSHSLERPKKDSWEFKNLTWKAPDLDARASHPSKIQPQSPIARRPSIMSDPSTGPRSVSEANHAKVDYNGLKAVPTGPKQKLASKAGAKPLPQIDPKVKLRPHIFISSEHLSAKQKTRHHLHQFLRSFIPREEDIYLDETGWYLCFDSTDTGRRHLTACFEKHDKAILFSMYTMHMECYPYGRLDVPRANINGDAVTPANNNAVTSPTNAASAAAQNFLEDLSLSLSSPMDPGTESVPIESASITSLTSPLPPQVAIHLQRSSPLSVPSRQERDETASSISGITGSDISASKRLSCHVCQKASTFEIDQPIRCSSCPRRYHRRCHPRPAIPLDLVEDHRWQCRRCVRKEVPLRSRLSNTSAPNADFSPAASVGQPDDEPSFQRLQVDILPPDMVRQINPPANGLLGPSIDDINGIKDTSKQAQAHGDQDLSDADDSYEPPDMPVVNGDEHNLSEANDLVAKSFATIEAAIQSPADPIKKSGKLKLNLVRKKIVRDPDSNSLQAAQDHPELSESPTADATTPPSQQNGSGEALQAAVPDTAAHTKLHRWSGGDTEKDIIKASRDDVLFQHTPASTNRIGPPVALFSAEVEVDQHAILEVAESPEELRKSGFHNQDGRAGEKMHPENGNAEAGFVASNPIAAVASNSTLYPSVQRKLGVGPRMKPGTPARSQCIKCKKVIAAMPSGKNIYCSGCKKGFSKEFYATSGIAGPEQLERGSERAPVEPTRANAGQDAEEIAQERTPAAEQSIPVQDPLQPTSTPNPKPRADTEKLSAPVVDEEREKDGSEGDLDFWKSKDSELDKAQAAAPSPVPIVEKSNDLEVDMDAPIANGYDDPEPETNADVQSSDEETSEESDRESPSGDNVDPLQSKRRSQTRPAKDTHDLGDSYTRPPNTYVKLIGMALCSAPGHRLKGNDIVQWVLENVPSYKAKEGKWENSLRATLTLKKAGYKNEEGLWKIVEDGAKKNEGFVYELLPGKAETMLHWDPVLRQPISPPKGWRLEHASKGGASDVRAKKKRLQHHTPDSTESPSKSSDQQRKQRDERGQLKATDRTQMQLDTPDESISAGTSMDRSIEDGDSSSSEPIARVRQKAKQSPTTDPKIADIEMTDAGASTAAILSAEIKQLVSSKVNQFTTEPPLPPPTRRKSCKVTLEEMIEAEAKEVTYTAKSLFEEWPEYDPKNYFDREAKIAEIKARPTRKQRFGKQSNSVELAHQGPISRYVFGDNNAVLPERPKRSSSRPSPAALYEWAAEEGETLVVCETIEEFFSMPPNPVAFIHEGEIAYRDGTKNWSRVIYKSGFF